MDWCSDCRRKTPHFWEDQAAHKHRKYLKCSECGKIKERVIYKIPKVRKK